MQGMVQEQANYKIMCKLWTEHAHEILRQFAEQSVKDFIMEALNAVDNELAATSEKQQVDRRSDVSMDVCGQPNIKRARQ